MNEQPIMQIRNISKQIGQKTIIDQLSFDVPRGEVFGFLGPNGAGKTTTIRMMVGLMSISEGEILINGLNISKQFEQTIQHVGAIVENPEMYKFLTGYQNLIHYARMNKGITKQRIQEVVKLVGMENRIHDKVKTYSLGMRQRLGVAQAILHKPALLILDEPTNGLDPAGIRELRDYLRRLTKEEGTSVVVSSHLLSEMELMCDRVAIIQNGKLIDVRLIKDYGIQDGDKLRVLFRIGDVSKALAVIQTQELKWDVELTEAGIILVMQKDQIPVVNKLLTAADVDVFGIEALNQSLEDKFLAMTGSDQIA